MYFLRAVGCFLDFVRARMGIRRRHDQHVDLLADGAVTCQGHVCVAFSFLNVYFRSHERRRRKTQLLHHTILHGKGV